MADADLLPTLLEKTAHEIEARRRFPEATYRLQFHAGFRFEDATRLVPYLRDLGITDCYASPYLKARPGSQHGYDIQDHGQLNPEIGTEEEYNAWVAALQAHGLGQVFDMVPNHMGIAGNDNAWWNDVLENGPSSPYAACFDIDWYSYKPALHNKLLLPVLGEPYGKVLEAQQLALGYDAGGFAVHYFEHRFPVEPCTYGKILSHRLADLEQALGKESRDLTEYRSILTAVTHLPPSSTIDPDKAAERHREKEVIKRRLAALTEASAPVREFIQQGLAVFNGRPADAPSFDLLDDLLRDQVYRLCFWRVAADEINYRRFFDVNELAALSMERPEVFAATHELVLRLLRERKVTGLRIDHPDGLFDPQQYLQRLQHHYGLACARAVFEATPEYRDLQWKELEGPLLEAIRRSAEQGGPESPFARPLYVVVEKILGKGEPLPEDWPVHGTTGYEFLNLLNGLFVAADHADALTRIYNSWTKGNVSFRDLVHDKKFLILQVSLSGELHMLAHQLDRLAQAHRWSRDFTLNSLRHALREIIACFPVYRSYITERGLPKRDPYYLIAAVARAKRKNPAISASIFDFVKEMLLLQHLEGAGVQERADQVRFVGKFQQVTSPVMAKGLEDTAFYTYNRLVSLNEVGGDPGQFGVSVPSFHRHNLDRQRQWPWSLSATSTHDTKRSEDARARINVLSELPREWQKRLTRWNGLNERHRAPREEEDQAAPDRNEEYLFYQTLVGVWPLGPLTAEDFPRFVERIQAYMQKAVHEAKEHSSWINPNPAHDEAVRQFVARVLDPQGNPRFLRHFRAFQRRISHYGLFNSLSQTLLKITAPGVPDIYQGTELWDFSLVDPDNRRPVDYELRRHLLDELSARLAEAGPRLPQLARELTETKEDGRIKLYVTARALHFRREHAGLFATGDYQAVDALGDRGENVCAFMRRSEGRHVLVAVPRLVTGLMAKPGDLPLGAVAWGDTVLLLPDADQGRSFRNVFTGETLNPVEQNGHACLEAARVFAHFPVALLDGRA